MPDGHPVADGRAAFFIFGTVNNAIVLDVGFVSDFYFEDVAANDRARTRLKWTSFSPISTSPITVALGASQAGAIAYFRRRFPGWRRSFFQNSSVQRFRFF